MALTGVAPVSDAGAVQVVVVAFPPNVPPTLDDHSYVSWLTGVSASVTVAVTFTVSPSVAYCAGSRDSVPLTNIDVTTGSALTGGGGGGGSDGSVVELPQAATTIDRKRRVDEKSRRAARDPPGPDGLTNSRTADADPTKPIVC